MAKNRPFTAYCQALKANDEQQIEQTFLVIIVSNLGSPTGDSSLVAFFFQYLIESVN
jgi:hypothetical protein